MQLNQKLTTAGVAAAGAMLLISSAAFAGTTDLTISGNGADSENGIKLMEQTSTVVSQSNQTSISNHVHTSSNTGDNTASGNTGGSVYIETGDATSKTQISNTTGSNTAHVENCDCDTDVTVKIDGNGKDSENKAKVGVDSMTYLVQENKTKMTNMVHSDADTGNNKANHNTEGDVTIVTGNAKSMVEVENQANSNVGGIGGNGEAGSQVDVMITDNGKDSTNKVGLKVDKLKGLSQHNSTRIKNKVGSFAGTGYNKAKSNTGGIIDVWTGNSTSKVNLKNTAGSNTGSVDCDCLTTDISAKIDGNGKGASAKIKAKMSAAVEVAQDNNCDPHHNLFLRLRRHRGMSHDCFDNHTHADAYTGGNKVKDSTVGGDDPLVLTGNSKVEVTIDNQAGFNQYPGLEI